MASAPPGGDERRDRRLLIVGGGPFQIDAIRTAKRLVREVWVVDRDPRAPGMALADRAVALDFGRPELVVELAGAQRFDGVITAASDAAVPSVAACVEAFGLTGISPEVAQRCRDKLATVETLQRAGLRAPASRRVDDVASARRELSAVGGYPVVIKPRSAAGGRGVSIVDSPAALDAAVAKALKYARPGQGCLVQEWISGLSVGVEAFLWEGRVAGAYCLSDQYMDGFVSPIGHALPCELDPALQARVVAVVESFCHALGLRSGPLNFDLRVEADGVCLIEVNPRLGGNSISQLVRTAHDIDLAEATVIAALGEDPSDALRPRGHVRPCATRLMMVRGLGTLAMRRWARDWRQCPGVAELEIAVRSGEPPATMVDDWAFLGRCLVYGETPGAAIALARSIAEDVQSSIRFAAVVA